MHISNYILGAIFAQGGRSMYLSEAYILMMTEFTFAAGFILMNKKGAIKPTAGFILSFVAYVIALAAYKVKTPHYPYEIANLF